MSEEAEKAKDLGMDREITRRDFLNGVAIGVGSSLLSSGRRPEDLLAAGVLDDFAPEKAKDYYPPALTGMRGNHDGTYTFAHRLRDGEAPDSFGAAEETGDPMTSLSWAGASAAWLRRTSSARRLARTPEF